MTVQLEYIYDFLIVLLEFIDLLTNTFNLLP